MRCVFAYVIECAESLICISVQTHKYIRQVIIQTDNFSAHALHEFFGCIMVRVSVRMCKLVAVLYVMLSECNNMSVLCLYEIVRNVALI